MTSATLIGVLVTFLVIILVLYLIGMLPIDGRAKQIARVIVIIIGVIPHLTAQLPQRAGTRGAYHGVRGCALSSR
jgi:hypothetical protein